MQIMRISVMATMLIAALALAGGALAQDAQGGGDSAQQGQAQAQQQPAPDVSDEQVDKFVDAYNGVMDVQREYIPKLQGAENDEEKKKLRQEATTEMKSAVEDAGMTQKEFQQVNQAARQDPALQKEIKQKIQSQRGNGNGGSGGDSGKSDSESQ